MVEESMSNAGLTPPAHARALGASVPTCCASLQRLLHFCFKGEPWQACKSCCVLSTFVQHDKHWMVNNRRVPLKDSRFHEMCASTDSFQETSEHVCT